MKNGLYANVLLPLAVKGTFTYSIPDTLAGSIKAGSFVLVGFGKNKIYSAIVVSLTRQTDKKENIKEIISLTDPPVSLSSHHLEFWNWIASYYMCTPGEVMRAALPSPLCLDGILESSGITLNRKYAPREESYVILAGKYSDRELNEILDRLSKAPRQQKLLLNYLRITGYSAGSDLFPVKRSMLLKESGALSSSLDILEKKGILLSLSLEVSRIRKADTTTVPPNDLNGTQTVALEETRSLLREKGIVLIHGVTSSGKTEIYIHLIEETLKQGKQVLYLLPEIALTSQITGRLRKHFGSATAVYHSRLSDGEQFEIWQDVGGYKGKNGISLILGARSALFLPFSNLGLIIVDEEHDSSYKQNDPAPRYNARDSAIMLGSMTGATVVLGSATPSIESYYNALRGKYGLVEMKERFGSVNMPDIIITDTKEAGRRRQMTSHFTNLLLHLMDEALERDEQVILFRNRRGFSSYLECSECGWIVACRKCSVNLTYHREMNRLKCHYCGSSEQVPSKCGNCGNFSMTTVGFGTEKLEDEIKIVFPEAKVDRIDHDSVSTGNSLKRILSAFESGRTDILIGTQMVSKGLDFENLTVVGILSADSMLNYPDFRAHERAFQLMSQVSGRSGRREKQGKVVIQTTDPRNTVIQQVIRNDYRGMFDSQLEERKLFNYPPFCRMIKISLKHREKDKLNEFSKRLGESLRTGFGDRVLGPEFPPLSRLQNWHIKNIILKVENNRPLSKAKEIISGAVAEMERSKGAGGLRINIDVDPY